MPLSISFKGLATLWHSAGAWLWYVAVFPLHVCLLRLVKMPLDQAGTLARLCPFGHLPAAWHIADTGTAYIWS